MNLYRRLGYDFLALTDHWILSKGGWYDNMLLLPGIELRKRHFMTYHEATKTA